MSTKKTVDAKELRTFGLSLGVVCLLWAGVFWWRGKTGAIPYFLVASPLLILTALTVPMALRPIHAVWMPLAKKLAQLVTWIVLSAVFYVVFTPYGLVMRLMGKDPLDRRFEPGRASYWIRRSDGPFDPERTLKQY
jgi:hypothetical protein